MMTFTDARILFDEMEKVIEDGKFSDTLDNMVIRDFATRIVSLEDTLIALGIEKDVEVDSVEDMCRYLITEYASVVNNVGDMCMRLFENEIIIKS